MCEEEDTASGTSTTTTFNSCLQPSGHPPQDVRPPRRLASSPAPSSHHPGGASNRAASDQSSARQPWVRSGRPIACGAYGCSTHPSPEISIDCSMGSGKAAASPPAAGGSGSPSPPGGAVCCMCGDRGLLPELFRCSACSVRSQHTYCTDRYPKVESYGTCNWCLKMDGGVASTSNSPRSAGKAAARPPAPHHGGDTTGSGRLAKVAARGDFASSNLSKPIKKQQPQQHAQRRLLLRRSASDLGTRVHTDHDAPPSPSVARGRPRVRRYKLLEEVITS